MVPILARHVRRPPDYRPPADAIPDNPEAVVRPEPVVPVLTSEMEDGIWQFQAPSPASSPWKESETIHGQVMGAENTRAAVLILHGAYGEYYPCQMLARPLVKHGYRALIPVAPGHLERTPKGMTSGAPFFWSAEAVVLGMAQWLADIRALTLGLREEGVERVGLVGYSIGSLTAGLAATLWDDLDFVAVLAPVGHHLQAIDRCRDAARLWPWMKGLSCRESALLDRWAPIHRRPAISRLLFLVTLFDALQPTDLQLAWWQAWGEPDQKQYRHGHLSVCFCRQLYRDLGQYAATPSNGGPETE
jgi:pimeloyl-ACP methyl ester carboxylesterase